MSISMYEKPQNLQAWADAARRHTSRLVKENFYQYQEHLKFVCILFSSTLNNFRSQITGVSDQSASRLVLETQECYATLWYSTSIFQFHNHLTCTHTPGDERRKGRRGSGWGRESVGERVWRTRIKKWTEELRAGSSPLCKFKIKRITYEFQLCWSPDSQWHLWTLMLNYSGAVVLY